MKRQYTSILLTLILAFTAAAEAQLRHDGFVEVPFEFLAAGKTLPAGTYKIGAVSEAGLQGLILSNYENRSGVYVLPAQFQASSSDRVKLSFEQIEDMHVLSSIQTSEGVYLFNISTRATAVAKARHVDSIASAGK